MQLKELIKVLKERDPNQKVSKGFYNPHSYRGYYDQLAFEPCGSTTVKEMLEYALLSLNRKFVGYKGGEYLMTGDTNLFIAKYGETGEEFSLELLEEMLYTPTPSSKVVPPSYFLTLEVEFRAGRETQGHIVSPKKLTNSFLRSFERNHLKRIQRKHQAVTRVSVVNIQRVD